MVPHNRCLRVPDESTLFRTAVPFGGKNYLRFEWLVLTKGTAVLKGLRNPVGHNTFDPKV